MDKIKDWWLHLAKDTKFIIVLLVIVIAMVIWFCGVKGNNESNFYYKPKTSVAQAPTDTTAKKKIVTINFPSKPIRGLNIIRGA